MSMRDGNSEIPSGVHLLHLLGKLAGVAGILTFLSCMAGAAHLLVMYSWLGCVWVFNLHGVNDFVFEGASPVAVFGGAAAVAYSISEDHKKILINISNWASALMFSVLIVLVSFDVGKLILGQFARHYFFAAAGVNLAGYLLWSMTTRDAFVLALYSFAGFALGALFASISYFYWLHNIYDSELVVLSNSKTNSSGVLINSFSGKHLLRVCGPGVRFMVIDPSEDWVSEPPGAKYCFGE